MEINESEYLKIAYKIGKNEYKIFKDLLKRAGLSQELMNKVDLHFADRFMQIRTLSFNDAEPKPQHSVVDKLYKEDLEKILFVVSSDKLLARIKGLKIMISGGTGTGKTTLAKKLVAELAPAYKLWEFRPENLVSSKMGQTQLNILKLTSDIQEASNNQKIILLIDEADSILSNRIANNDVAEFQRVASSFIKMLDELNEKVLVIFLTNIPDKIDLSIARRMNFHIKSRMVSVAEFLDWVAGESKILFTTQQKNSLLTFFKEASFSVSELDSFLNGRAIDQSMGRLNNEFAYFIKFFYYKKPVINNPSKRLVHELETVGINELQN